MTMYRKNRELERTRRATFSTFTIWAVLFAACFPLITTAQQPSQKTFASAEEASQAIFAAVQKDDEKAMFEILGPDNKGIISSGNPAQDKQERADFVNGFQRMHRLVKEPDGTTTLYIGAQNWPMPIPLMSKGGRWYFDAVAAKQEILFERIGHNELSAIRVCQELVAAQKEYYASNSNEYAQKFLSDEGQHNGLHWGDPDKRSDSPVGPMVAHAGTNGSAVNSQSPAPVPFRGYFFRMLAAQGKDVSGGAMAYAVDGKMTKGFAFVAYPAAYRDSGVMTFVVNQDGVVYEKDLGKGTSLLAKSMKIYGPDATWRKSDIAEDLEAEQKAGRK
jgi:hypothetical protein